MTSIAVLGLAMASCSNEELENSVFADQNVIGFNVVTNGAQRATPTTPTNLTSTDFNVFAFTTTGDYYLGNSATKGVNIAHAGGKWGYTTPSDQRYWPNTPLNFYAVNPATSDAHSKGIYNWNFDANTQQIYYTCNPNEFNTGTSTYKNVDVMYAIAKNQEQSTNNGTVKFQFKHILSQVLFQAKTEREDIDVTIENIDIQNVRIGGTFTLPTDAATEATTANNWVSTFADSAPYPFFRAVYNANLKVEGKTETGEVGKVFKLNQDNPMLVIPQTLTAWNVNNPTTKTKVQADIAQQSYLIITCKIKQGPAYIFGSESDYKTLYIPFGASWEPGKRYIYTIIFGGGYDDQGNKIMKPIEIEAESAADWVDIKSPIQY